MTARTRVEAFFDDDTFTVSYIVADEATRCAAVVDPVLDFDFKSGRTRTVQADRLLAHLREHGLTLQWILETHAHADHLSAAPYLKQQLGGRIAIGGHITTVQDVFKRVFHLEPEFRTDGAQFDHLFQDGETFAIGALQAKAIATPGHTPSRERHRPSSSQAMATAIAAQPPTST